MRLNEGTRDRPGRILGHAQGGWLEGADGELDVSGMNLGSSSSMFLHRVKWKDFQKFSPLSDALPVADAAYLEKLKLGELNSRFARVKLPAVSDGRGNYLLVV